MTFKQGSVFEFLWLYSGALVIVYYYFVYPNDLKPSTMENEIDYSVFIERYLDKEMSAAEQEWFIRELKGNSMLKKELDFRGKLNVSIAETEIMDFRKELENVFSNSNFRPVTKSKRDLSALGIAILSSALVISFMILIITGFPYRRLDNQEIYRRYFKPAEADFTFRAESGMESQILHTAIKYYEEGNYQLALVYFEKILESDSTQTGLNLYSGIFQMELKKYEDARKSFNKIIHNHYVLYIEQAEWYLAFCYLMTNNTQKAREQFAQIEKRKGYYWKQSRRILRKLESGQ
jgi:tetratricopeptide (TPR) repeat protein